MKTETAPAPEDGRSMATYIPEKHTPTPSALPGEAWDDDGTGTLPCILAKQVTAFGNFYVAQRNNFHDAAFIVRACNSHQDLIDTLKAAQAACQRHFDSMPAAWQTYDDLIEQTLRKAGAL